MVTTVPPRTLHTQDGYVNHSAADEKEHYTAIVMGAGLSGMATAIQLKRKLGLTDVLVYEKSDDIGGTWSVNRYVGAACDIPLIMYSFSFDPAYDVSSQWAGQAEILRYLHGVQRRFKLDNVVFRNAVETATFSRATGLWTLSVLDEVTGTVRTRTCNILISCLGGLTIPNDPGFETKDFDGVVFHSARWGSDVELKGKHVVVVGNGCSAVQIVPELVKDVGPSGSVTQVARSRQTVFPRIPIPSSSFFRGMLKWLPGFGFLIRCLVFFGMEKAFIMSDIANGEKYRTEKRDVIAQYIQRHAPKQYHDALTPDFDLGAKRRVFDSGYYASLHEPNMSLLADDAVTSVKGSSVLTKKGKVIENVDVVVLATGFKVRDYLFPLDIRNGEGEKLQERLKGNGVATYQSTLVAGYPNFFWVMGPNSATGHSSVLFTSECQLTLTFHLIRPILARLRQQQLETPGTPVSTQALLPKAAPYVEVTQEAETRYWNALRREMKKKVWEKDGGVSWYVDKDTGYCTTLYPHSQIHFWRSCAFPTLTDFKWTGVEKPASWRVWLHWW